MKKKTFIILTLIIYASVSMQTYCSANSQEFIKKFSTCSYFVDNGEKRISAVLGWSTRRCYYKEITHLEEITCGFKQLELQNVANAMKKENYDHTKGITSLKTIDNYLYFSPEICDIKSKNSYNQRSRTTRRRYR